MSSPPRFLPPGSLALVTSRTQEGLPFVCTLYMALIIKGILARAYSLFPVTVNAYKFMGNHFHMLVVTTEPMLVISFVDHVKTELAHAVNRLLGRRRRSVWCEGFDAEPILTRESAISKFVYLYTNAQKAGLVDLIEKYPGVNSWEMFVTEEHSFTAPWIQRMQIERLISTSVSRDEDLRLTQELREGAKEKHTFVLQPYAWINCFAAGSRDRAQVKAEIIQRVREQEEILTRDRKIPCIGAERLRRQAIDVKYTPSKHTKRMWCICDDVELRVAFIAWAKKLIAEGRAVYRRWKAGDRSAQYPPGLFPPSFPKLANVVPKFAFQTI